MVNFFVEKLRVDQERAKDTLDEAVEFIDQAIDQLVSYERQYKYSMPRPMAEKIDTAVLTRLEAIDRLYEEGFAPPMLPRLLQHGRALRDGEGRKRWLKRAASGIKSILYTMEDDDAPTEAAQESSQATEAAATPKRVKGNAPVFAVFHKEEKLGETLARTLRLLAIRPVAYRAGAESIAPVLDQMRDEMTAGFAFVMVGTNDGRPISSESAQANARNIVLELGFLIGLLGKDRVRVLRKGNIDLPPDIEKTMTIEVDPAGAWRVAALKELEFAGYKIAAASKDADAERSRLIAR